MGTLNNAKVETDKLLKDTALDTEKRKIKIVKIAKDALDTQAIDPNITCKIMVNFNDTEIASFISAIGSVDNFSYPEAPIFSVGGIHESSASILFSNMKSSYQCKVELAVNGDVNNWIEQKSEISDENNYVLKDLKSETDYFVRSQYTNKYGAGPISITVQFKTKAWLPWKDQWDQQSKANEFVIAGDVAYSTYSGWRSIFGQQFCEAPYKYHWKLKIVEEMKNISNQWPPLVGVQMDGQLKYNSYFTASKSAYGFIGGHAKLTTDGSTGKEYGQKWRKVNDVIDVYLDMNNCTLSFGINGTKYGVAHYVDAGKYILALSLYNGRKVKMISSSKRLS